jgi:Rrf2 family iron-responsive transcriptional regulator
MITREADYCIRTILYLAQPENRDRSVSMTELAESMYIPYRFLRKIVNRMVGGGVLESQRGRNGGLKLTRAPERISLLDVLRLTDSKGVLLNSCLDGNEFCPRQGCCRVHQEIGKLQSLLQERLQTITFDQLV